MATKAASFGGAVPHTSGLFADMTVDGPEIGTLVIVVDRAKNLPNRKTMGKQNPYCAARLGKEAQKTETDKRGGQTPKWDQELRFTVHDSPDYHKLKISVFSEDKRTDLVGEAWVDLTGVVVPGGGKSDLWQGLNYKGKYAGELRIELTYYDERPKPEPAPESVAGTDELRQSVGAGSGKVKRRPLPTNPNAAPMTADSIPAPAIPGRARHGPRDFRTPPRANSMPPQNIMQSQQQPPYPPPGQDPGYASPPMGLPQQTPPNVYRQEHQDYHQNGYQVSLQQPDFLPQLPPSNRQRARQSTAQSRPTTQTYHDPQPLPQHTMALQHSHSAPSAPQTVPPEEEYDNGYQLRTEYPEPIPDIDFQHQQLSRRPRRSDVRPEMYDEYHDPYAGQPPMEDEDYAPPPPPPMHSNSAPAVPQYGSPHAHPMSSSPVAVVQTPPHTRHHSVPNASPLQSIEHNYGTPPRMPGQGPAMRGSSVDGHMSSPEPWPYHSSPVNAYTAQSPSPYTRSQPARSLPHRNSIAEPYSNTPSRLPHPLSQEVPRPRSPLPPPRQPSPSPTTYSGNAPPYQSDYCGRDAVPLIKPRAISPQPTLPPSQPSSAPRPRSSYSIQHPIRAFESSEHSPLSTSRPPVSLQTSQRSTPVRKSISIPNTPNSSGAGGVPFSPDSFDAYNPNAQRPMVANGTSPHSPFQVTDAPAPDRPSGPIVGWHGQEIDPSDHLPVDSWAPEPEKKTPTKTYGLGRSRDFGPRSAQNTPPGNSSYNISKDTVVNIRMKQHSEDSPSRNRLQKKTKSPAIEPLREHHNFNSVSVPNPYEQQEYSRGFYESNDHGYSNPSGGYGEAPFSSSPNDALAREIASIDIGSSRHGRVGSVPAPVAYVPVRSHRDRNTYY